MSARRLNGRQIGVLRSLIRRAGATARVSLYRGQRPAAVSLWRRGLVEVWYRQVPGDAMQGPYFALTIAGWQLASAFVGREAR